MLDYIKRKLHACCDVIFCNSSLIRPECPISEFVPNDLPNKGDVLVNINGDFINMSTVTMLARYVEWDWCPERSLSNYRTITMYQTHKGMLFYVEQRKDLNTGEDALRHWSLHTSQTQMSGMFFKAVMESDQDPTRVRIIFDKKFFTWNEL